MKKILKKIVAIVFALSVLLTTNSSFVYAAELDSNYGKYTEIEGEECKIDILSPNSINGKKYSSKSLKNYVFMSITPQSASYKITITNIGIDTVDSVKIKCVVRKNSDALYASTTKTFTHVKPGFTTWTWNLKKGDTVQEKITVSGTARDGKDSSSFSSSTVRYNFAGGKYGTMKSYDGQKHHMSSDSVNGLTTYVGPCIRMITSEHRKTASFGNSTSAKKFREKEKKKVNDGKFLAAQQLGVTDVQNKFGLKYNGAINDMIKYTKNELKYKK